MNKYSQKTLPIQAGKLLHNCPVCKTKYMIRAKTGNGAIYYHNRYSRAANNDRSFMCVVKT